MDNCCNTYHPMDAGAGDGLYNGLFYSYPAGRRNCRGVDQGHSGAKTCINNVSNGACPVGSINDTNYKNDNRRKEK